MNPIEILIEEASELGVNVHDHIALKTYGVSNPTTRQKAKEDTFGYLYGGGDPVLKAENFAVQMDNAYKAFKIPAYKSWRNTWGDLLAPMRVRKSRSSDNTLSLSSRSSVTKPRKLLSTTSRHWMSVALAYWPSRCTEGLGMGKALPTWKMNTLNRLWPGRKS